MICRQQFVIDEDGFVSVVLVWSGILATSRLVSHGSYIGETRCPEGKFIGEIAEVENPVICCN